MLSARVASRVVTGLREFTRKACVSVANVIPTSPELIVGRGAAAALPTLLSSFLSYQCIELPQLV
jgi:hypothetical protein